MLERWQLIQRQQLPLEVKIELSKKKIREWYEHWNGEVYVAFSGGKDSTVLLDLVRSIYPEVPGVFSDTGLEYPEIKEFVKSQDNIVYVRPKKTFRQVIEEDGYPVISKRVARYIRDLQNPTEKNKHTRHLRLTGYTADGRHLPSYKLPQKWLPLVDAPFKVSEKCCDHIKKQPLKQYSKRTGRKPFIGVMAEESNMREKQYLTHGCNLFGANEPISHPMGFWTEQDVLNYLLTYKIPYCNIYGNIVKNKDGLLETTGEKRTGCMFCMFGVHLEKGENRFQRMKRTHPQIWDYCMNNLGIKKVLEYIGVEFE